MLTDEDILILTLKGWVPYAVKFQNEIGYFIHLEGGTIVNKAGILNIGDAPFNLNSNAIRRAESWKDIPDVVLDRLKNMEDWQSGLL